MGIERAVVKGLLGGVVETRNMFTCNVTPAGGDTALILWDAYITSILDPIEDLTSSSWASYAYELQGLAFPQWVPYDIITCVHTGANSGDFLPNAVATVLLGKAPGLRHVGRKFISGMAESSVSGNALTVGALVYAAAVLLAYITPFTGLGGGTIVPGVIDKVGTFHAFTGGVVSSLLGSMRRRKPGVGI